jgi:hypothetical protein
MAIRQGSLGKKTDRGGKESEQRRKTETHSKNAPFLVFFPGLKPSYPPTSITASASSVTDVGAAGASARMLLRSSGFFSSSPLFDGLGSCPKRRVTGVA